MPHGQLALRRGRLGGAHPVKQIHIGKRGPRPDGRRQEPLPPGPRDRDIVKVRQRARSYGLHDTGRRHSPRRPA